MKEKKMLLIYGEPGSGKSYLSNQLNKENAFIVISVDELYIEFVKVQCPSFYFENLENYISEHYQRILIGAYTERKYGRNIFQEWQNFFVNAILSKIKLDTNLIVEGYLVKDCIDKIASSVPKYVKVFRINVYNGQYQLEIPISIEKIATLNSKTICM